MGPKTSNLNFLARRSESVVVLYNSILSFWRFFQNVEQFDNLRKYNLNDVPNKFMLLTFST